MRTRLPLDASTNNTVMHVAPKVAVTYGGMCGPGCARPITVVIRRVGGKDMLRDMYLLIFFRLSQIFPSINTELPTIVSSFAFQQHLLTNMYR